MKFTNVFPLIICSFLFIFNINAQPNTKDSTNVLFIGNSFTVLNSTPDMFDSLATEAGLKVHVGSYLHLGVGVDFFSANDTCWQQIKSRKWDYVIIQDLQSNYYDSFGTFPKNILPDNLKFQDSIKKLIPCVKIVYMAGWEMQGGIPTRFPGDNTYLLIDRILANYAYLNNQKGVHNTISPVGVAWKICDLDRKDLVLVSSDYRHPSKYGSYLYASVMFATVFKQDPTNLKYSWILPAANTQYLRKLAYQSLMDTLPYTNLDTITIPYSKDKNILTAHGIYTGFHWYKNNIPIPGAIYDTLNVKDTTAFYTVMAGNTNGCSFTSFTQYWPQIPKTTGVGLNNSAQYGFSIYPNPSHGYLTMEFDKTIYSTSQVFIYTIDGKIIRSLMLDHENAKSMNLDLQYLPKGMYIAEVVANGGVSRQKFLIE